MIFLVILSSVFALATSAPSISPFISISGESTAQFDIFADRADWTVPIDCNSSGPIIQNLTATTTDDGALVVKQVIVGIRIVRIGDDEKIRGGHKRLLLNLDPATENSTVKRWSLDTSSYGAVLGPLTSFAGPGTYEIQMFAEAIHDSDSEYFSCLDTDCPRSFVVSDQNNGSCQLSGPLGGAFSVSRAISNEDGRFFEAWACHSDSALHVDIELWEGVPPTRFIRMLRANQADVNGTHPWMVSICGTADHLIRYAWSFRDDFLSGGRKELSLLLKADASIANSTDRLVFIGSIPAPVATGAPLQVPVCGDLGGAEGCNSNGACDGADAVGSCSCDPGYNGTLCEVELDTDPLSATISLSLPSPSNSESAVGSTASMIGSAASSAVIEPEIPALNCSIHGDIEACQFRVRTNWCPASRMACRDRGYMFCSPEDLMICDGLCYPTEVVNGECRNTFDPNAGSWYSEKVICDQPNAQSPWKFQLFGAKNCLPQDFVGSESETGTDCFTANNFGNSDSRVHVDCSHSSSIAPPPSPVSKHPIKTALCPYGPYVPAPCSRSSCEVEYLTNDGCVNYVEGDSNYSQKVSCVDSTSDSTWHWLIYEDLDCNSSLLLSNHTNYGSNCYRVGQADFVVQVDCGFSLFGKAPSTSPPFPTPSALDSAAVLSSEMSYFCLFLSVFYWFL